MITLKKQFSREKSLLYFCMWDRSDRAGYERFVGHRVRHNLFHLPKKDHKVHVCYADQELNDLFRRIEEQFLARQELWEELASHLDAVWEQLRPYLQTPNSIQHVDDFLVYFQHLTDWWTAMTVTFFIPDIQGVHEEVRRKALEYREQGEKYTEIAHERMHEFWDRHAAEDVRDLFLVVTPEEAEALLRQRLSTVEIEKIRQRMSGYGMFNGVVYLLPELERVLATHNIHLEQEEITEEMMELRGVTAQPGCVRGKARVVIKIDDARFVEVGEILIAEMTNPSYVPAMKKAAAFVTDEGGLTCHAGIVARELGTPCIVGTRIATLMFKTGDMIEVDASRGIVRRV